MAPTWAVRGLFIFYTSSGYIMFWTPTLRVNELEPFCNVEHELLQITLTHHSRCRPETLLLRSVVTHRRGVWRQEVGVTGNGLATTVTPVRVDDVSQGSPVAVLILDQHVLFFCPRRVVSAQDRIRMK